MQGQREPYLRTLVGSDRERSCWTGASPDNPNELWFFEAVEVDGHIIAIRQIAVGGERSLGYSADHLEDELGFLTDQPLKPDAWGLSISDPASFEHEWTERTNG